MMDVKYQELVSVESPEADAPWYVVEVKDGDVVVTEDKDGGRESGLSTAAIAIPDHVDIPNAAEVSGSGWVRYAVTEDGEFISYDPMELNTDVPSLRAHLGLYNPTADTLTLLEFIES